MSVYNKQIGGTHYKKMNISVDINIKEEEKT